MIEINMNTARQKLTVKGHATPEESEQFSEICSASGALAQAMVYAATRAVEGAAVKELDYKPERGDLMVKIYPEAGYEKTVQEIFRLYGYGMELLAKSHPCSVTMIFDGEKIIPDKEGRT